MRGNERKKRAVVVVAILCEVMRGKRQKEKTANCLGVF
jgi:hypothetical protein